MKYTLSVTIPSYRQPEQLQRALHALSLQTFKDFEVIIIDDASGISFEEIINTYKDNLTISVLVNKDNLGAMKNIEKSITVKTDSEYIFSHHEDDYIKNNYLEEAIAILTANKKISFIASSPVWIKKNEPFRLEKINKVSEPLLFNSREFIIASLKLEPFMFGSVIYRKKDIVVGFDLPTYNTLCDKVFLTELLIKNNSVCAYIQEPSIYVRDHTLDKKDTRSKDATATHCVNLFQFYKKELVTNTKETKKLITNGLLLCYANLYKKASLPELFREQKKYTLIHIQHINHIGLYALYKIITRK